MPSSGKSSKFRLPNGQPYPKTSRWLHQAASRALTTNQPGLVGLEPALGLDELRFLDHAATLYASA